MNQSKQKMSRKMAAAETAYTLEKKERMRDILGIIRNWKRDLQASSDEGIEMSLFGDPARITLRRSVPNTELLMRGGMICDAIAKLNRLSLQYNGAAFLSRFFKYQDVKVSKDTRVEESEIFQMILDFEDRCHEIGIAADTMFAE